LVFYPNLMIGEPVDHVTGMAAVATALAPAEPVRKTETRKLNSKFEKYIGHFGSSFPC
jgi:hypothetical protein